MIVSVDPSLLSPAQASDALLEAVLVNDEATVARMLPLADPRFIGQALRSACEREYIPCVTLLLEHVGEQDVYNMCVKTAQCGPSSMLPVLFNAHPAFAASSLYAAAKYGMTDCLSVLIPLVDPKINNSKALQWAVVMEQVECIELLYPISDPVAALNELKPKSREQIWLPLESRIQRETLLHATNDGRGVQSARKR